MSVDLPLPAGWLVKYIYCILEGKTHVFHKDTIGLRQNAIDRTSDSAISSYISQYHAIVPEPPGVLHCVGLASTNGLVLDVVELRRYFSEVSTEFKWDTPLSFCSCISLSFSRFSRSLSCFSLSLSRFLLSSLGNKQLAVGTRD